MSGYYRLQCERISHKGRGENRMKIYIEAQTLPGQIDRTENCRGTALGRHFSFGFRGLAVLLCLLFLCFDRLLKIYKDKRLPTLVMMLLGVREVFLFFLLGK